MVELVRRYYGDGDESVLPLSVATRDAFENAMALDIAMGGSTNTILHLLAAAHEARVGFGLKEIDELSRRVPCLCKVAPSSSYHVEDVHRAGGIPAILGELDRAGLLNQGVHTVHSPSLRAFLGQWDIRSDAASPEARELFHAAPGGVRTIRPYSQNARWGALDEDRAEGCIRDRQHAYSADGGLAVLYGNLAPEGAIVKTAGVPEELWRFAGPARVFESQEDAVEGILGGQVTAGDVVVIRYEGPKGGPGHAGDALPDQLPQGQGAGPGLRAHHRRPVLRRHLGAVHLPRRAGGGRGRHDRAGPGRRPDRDRHPAPRAHAGRARSRARRPPGAAGRRAASSRLAATARSARRCRSTRAMATSASTGAVRDLGSCARCPRTRRGRADQATR